MLSFIRSLFDPDSLVILLLRLPCVLLAISVHESAHGYMAEKLGDPTARSMGRISLNPARHFNLFGTICMLVLGFGWATPVPINVSNFKKPKRDMALCALAGPISNILMMVIGLLLSRIFSLILIASGTVVSVGGAAYYTVEKGLATLLDAIDLLLYLFTLLNASLAVFNLIPIPPLDGSRLLTAFLPLDKYYRVMQYEQYMMIALLLLSFTGALSGIISLCTGAMLRFGNGLLDLIPFLRL